MTYSGTAPRMTQEQGTSSSDVSYPAWQPEYKAAFLEFDPKKLRESVQAAEAAIFNRLQELKQSLDSLDSEAERQAIQDALSALRLLQRDTLDFPDGEKK